MNRRSLLASLAALPLTGWGKPPIHRIELRGDTSALDRQKATFRRITELLRATKAGMMTLNDWRRIEERER